MENLFEQIMKENFPNLAKEIDFQEVQEAQRVPEKLDPRRNTLRDIIITSPMIKDEEKILKAADFSKEILQARRGWKEVFQVMKGKNLHPRLFYPEKLHLEWKGR